MLDKAMFKSIFSDKVVIRMCWAHMRKAVKTKAETLSQKENANKILKDFFIYKWL